MPAAFTYPCPECRSASGVHDPACEFGGRDRGEIEAAYADILAVVAAEPVLPSTLRDRVPGEWTDLHGAALARLRSETRVVERIGDELTLLSPEERREQVSTPTHDPLRTIYEEGSYRGCHDNAVFAMVSFYEMQGFSWAETKERVTEWIRESGTWGRGGFSEGSPEEVVENKRHVWDRGYGWKEKATAAKRVIDRKRGGGGSAE